MADDVEAATPVQRDDNEQFEIILKHLDYATSEDGLEAEMFLRSMRRNLSDHQAALAAANEKHRFGSCEVCWNMAWVPCPESEPNAVPMKCSNGTTYWRCDYCWMKQQLAAANENVASLHEQIKDLQDELDREAEVADTELAAARAEAGKLVSILKDIVGGVDVYGHGHPLRKQYTADDEWWQRKGDHAFPVWLAWRALKSLAAVPPQPTPVHEHIGQNCIIGGVMQHVSMCKAKVDNILSGTRRLYHHYSQPNADTTRIAHDLSMRVIEPLEAVQHDLTTQPPTPGGE